jgi:hypothetical protein
MESRGERLVAYLLTALSLSIGWGIRGNFGHEYGAMLPGALAAMGFVLMSGRTDWLPRIPWFALFGALGWSFGGSISYMQIIGYTHSGHSPSVLYGFAGLFVIGFLWAAMGGAGTALAAVADRRRLIELLPVLGLVFVFWWLQGVAIEPWLRSLGVDLNWYDTDWLAATLALIASLTLVLLRRRVDHATSLVLHLAGGWWLGFGLLVLVLGLRMTPPRGDNWAGCLGMAVGTLVYCVRTGLPEVARATLVSGFIGGIGFAAASMFKLVEVTSGYNTNWHSILEQTTGLFNGIGIAVAMDQLARRSAPIEDETGSRPNSWAEATAVGFVLLVIPYLNLRKNVKDWVGAGVIPAEMYGISAWLWFELAAFVVASGVIILLVRHTRRPLAVVPADPLGQGQGLYLILLATMVIGNFERALVGFADQRLVTEGVIHLNAVIAAVMLLTNDRPARRASELALSGQHTGMPVNWFRLVGLGLFSALLSIALDWGVVRTIYGDRFAGHAGYHVRFGPNATTSMSRGGTPPAP